MINYCTAWLHVLIGFNSDLSKIHFYLVTKYFTFSKRAKAWRWWRRNDLFCRFLAVVTRFLNFSKNVASVQIAYYKRRSCQIWCKSVKGRLRNGRGRKKNLKKANRQKIIILPFCENGSIIILIGPMTNLKLFNNYDTRVTHGMPLILDLKNLVLIDYSFRTLWKLRKRIILFCLIFFPTK